MIYFASVPAQLMAVMLAAVCTTSATTTASAPGLPTTAFASGEMNVGAIGEGASSHGTEEGDLMLRHFKKYYARQAIRGDFFLWTNGFSKPTIRYIFHKSIASEDASRAAFAHYEEHTCIRFKEGRGVTGHLVLRDGNGCASFVGRLLLLSLFGQTIQLSPGCAASMTTVIHELAHALGLYHEQSRSDRNDHVEILLDNVRQNARRNFNRLNTRNFGSDYDLYSVIHYGPLSFSMNGATTMAAKNPLAQGLMILPRMGLTFMDKLVINKLYRCTDRWLKGCDLKNNPCQNLGYTGADCTCVCPEGTTGDLCENLHMPYTEALMANLLPLNEELTSPTTISSENYPEPQTDGVVFTKVVTAPACQRVVLTVVDVDMYRRCYIQRCCWEGLEVRLEDSISSSKWYCGTELTAGQILTTKAQRMVLFYFRRANSGNTKTGFSVDITFEDIDGCTKLS